MLTDNNTLVFFSALTWKIIPCVDEKRQITRETKKWGLEDFVYVRVRVCVAPQIRILGLLGSKLHVGALR
jgi:hypothetical protein